MKYALKNMVILNGKEDMTPQKGMAILVDAETVADIVPENEIPAGYEVIDLGGDYLLPGLINLHVHIPSSGRPTKKKLDYSALAALLKYGAFRALIRRLCMNYAKDELFSGVTTLRAVGGVMDFDTNLRDKINAGKTVGPRILAANYAVSVPGGHMTGSVALPVTTPEEARQMVRDLAKTKPDLIKLMITGGILDASVPGEPDLKMPPEIAEAAADEAHKLGYKVAAHVESPAGMRVALESGVDTLEHGGRPEEDLMDKMQENGAVLVGTLSPAVPFCMIDTVVSGLSEMDVFNGKMLLENEIACMKECLRRGITVGLGTDTGCPYTTHYDMWRELVYYCKYCDVTPAFALHTATELNARIAGVDAVTGTVEKGKSADFIVVKGDPLADLAVLRRLDRVIFRGRIHNNPKPRKIAKVESALDQIMKD